MTKRNLLNIEVDIEKIDMIIKNNGLTDAKFSESLGYEKSFLNYKTGAQSPSSTK